MLKTLLKVAGLLACLTWLNIASAASMGGINVTSALGHPLKAEISLAELGKNDKTAIAAKMASVNEFKSAGLDYPYSLPKLNFEVDTRANGEHYLKITSTQPVNEPFVSLLIELSWPSGKLLREYTFLLDPAGFAPEQPKAAEVKPVEPVVPLQEPAEPAISLPVVAPEVAALPPAGETQGVVAEPVPELSDMAKAELAAAETAAAKPVPVESAPVQAEPAPDSVLAEPAKAESAEEVKVEPLAPPPSPQAVAAATSILVEKGDTLAGIANDLKPVDVSLERMLVAMYRANAKKFDGKNMNRIRAGKILRMPESDEIEKVSQSAAVKEIRAQVADWQDYRQKLAAAQSSAAEQAPKQEAAGKISAAVAEKAPVIKESAKEVLKLSKGESLGDKPVSEPTVKSKQEKLADKADDAKAKSLQLEEEKKKIAALEGINKDVSKLVELKGGAVAANGAEIKPAESAPAAAAAAKKRLPASAVPETPPAEEEFDVMAMLSGLMPDDPMLLGVGLAVLLGLGGLGYVVARRAKTGQKKSGKKIDVSSKKGEDPGSATGSWRTPVVPSPDTGDFTQAASPSPAAPMSVAAALDDVDPISEADLFLNFGRDAQAEEILKDALSKNSSNNQVKLKLLSIYANRKDSNTFSRYAQEIKDSGDTAAWERAAVMGREIDPDNPNYGGVAGEVRHRDQPKAEVDFDLGFGKPSASSAVVSEDFKMDFDVTGNQSSASKESIDISTPFSKPSGVTYAKSSADVDATSILSKADVAAAQASSPMDFDVSGILPGDAKQIAQSNKMDFDVSGTSADAIGGGAKSMMDFDLSGNIPVAPEVKSASPSINFDDLVFDIPTSQPEPVRESPKAVADEGMEFTVDFSSSNFAEPTPVKPEQAKKLDIDFGDININLNLDGDKPPAHEGGDGKDDQWHEVATKLDLAKAYQEMGDVDGAREILEEVIRDGDETQRESAGKLLQQISA